MGITQQLGASSIIKPGVIDNTAARPASPYEGQVIFQKDTDQLLVWNGTAWVMIADTDSPPGMQKITPTAVSGTGVSISGSNVILTAAPEPYITCFSSEFSHYRIMGYLTAFTGGAAALTVRMANGSTANTTAANYRNFGYEGGYSSSAVSGVNNNGSTAGWNVGRVDGSGQHSSFIMDIQNPFDVVFTSYSSNFRDYLYGGVQNGMLQVTTSYDGFNPRIGGSNTMTGVIQIYGFRN
jgi:hypothetical protein